MAGGCGADDQPSKLRNGEGGDEAGNRVPVRVVVLRDRLKVSDDVVASFLAVRLRLVNRQDRRVRVTVEHDGTRVGRATVPAGGRKTLDLEGRRTGTLEVRATVGTARIAVEPGAG